MAKIEVTPPVVESPQVPEVPMPSKEMETYTRNANANMHWSNGENIIALTALLGASGLSAYGVYRALRNRPRKRINPLRTTLAELGFDKQAEKPVLKLDVPAPQAKSGGLWEGIKSVAGNIPFITHKESQPKNIPPILPWGLLALSALGVGGYHIKKKLDSMYPETEETSRLQKLKRQFNLLLGAEAGIKHASVDDNDNDTISSVSRVDSFMRRRFEHTKNAVAPGWFWSALAPAAAAGALGTAYITHRKLWSNDPDYIKDQAAREALRRYRQSRPPRTHTMLVDSQLVAGRLDALDNAYDNVIPIVRPHSYMDRKRRKAQAMPDVQASDPFDKLGELGLSSHFYKRAEKFNMSPREFLTQWDALVEHDAFEKRAEQNFSGWGNGEWVTFLQNNPDQASKIIKEVLAGNNSLEIKNAEDLVARLQDDSWVGMGKTYLIRRKLASGIQGIYDQLPPEYQSALDAQIAAPTPGGIDSIMQQVSAAGIEIKTPDEAEPQGLLENIKEFAKGIKPEDWGRIMAGAGGIAGMFSGNGMLRALGIMVFLGAAFFPQIKAQLAKVFPDQIKQFDEMMASIGGGGGGGDEVTEDAAGAEGTEPPVAEPPVAEPPVEPSEEELRIEEKKQQINDDFLVRDNQKIEELNAKAQQEIDASGLNPEDSATAEQVKAITAPYQAEYDAWANNINREYTAQFTAAEMPASAGLLGSVGAVNMQAAAIRGVAGNNPQWAKQFTPGNIRAGAATQAANTTTANTRLGSGLRAMGRGTRALPGRIDNFGQSSASRAAGKLNAPTRLYNAAVTAPGNITRAVGNSRVGQAVASSPIGSAVGRLGGSAGTGASRVGQAIGRGASTIGTAAKALPGAGMVASAGGKVGGALRIGGKVFAPIVAAQTAWNLGTDAYGLVTDPKQQFANLRAEVDNTDASMLGRIGAGVSRPITGAAEVGIRGAQTGKALFDATVGNADTRRIRGDYKNMMRQPTMTPGTQQYSNRQSWLTARDNLSDRNTAGAQNYLNEQQFDDAFAANNARYGSDSNFNVQPAKPLPVAAPVPAAVPITRPPVNPLWV